MATTHIDTGVTEYDIDLSTGQMSNFVNKAYVDENGSIKQPESVAKDGDVELGKPLDGGAEISLMSRTEAVDARPEA